MPEWSEILVILLVAMVVFGPHRLPAMARKAGKMMAEFRVAARELREGIEKELAVEEMRDAAKDVLATTAEATEDLRESLSESERNLGSPPPLARPTDTKPGAERSDREGPDNPVGPGETGDGSTTASPDGQPPNVISEDSQPDPHS